MKINEDTYCKNLLSRLLTEAAPCKITIDAQVASLSFSEPLRDPSADGRGFWAYRRQAVTEDGLSVTVLYKQYHYGALYWEVVLHNDSGSISGLIEDPQFARVCSDAPLRQAPGVGFSRLLYNRGSNAQAVDWQPLDEDLREGTHTILQTEHARGTDRYFPYFNYDLGDGTGFISAICWSGRWKAVFYRHTEQAEAIFTYHNAAFRLQPGESVTLPAIMVLPWKTNRYTKDCADSFNYFRRFVKEYIMPKQHGKEFSMPITMRAWGNIDPDGHNIRIQNIQKYHLHADSYGIDAGWYALGNSTEPYPDWHKGVGDWRPAPGIFPEGIGALSAQAKAAGMGFWMWFEFERAVSGSNTVAQHPEYYLKSAISPHICAVNLADPAARKYILNKLRPIIDETGMNIFRIDFNYDPAQYFAEWDDPQRKGLTELHYYNGLYAFFEEMLAVYPDIVIDNCAGGGRRMDLRMCHYAIPVMCSSDYFCWKDYEPEGIQGHTWGISRWIPISGDSVGSCSGNTSIVMDTYRVRSSMRSSIGLAAPAWPLTQEQGGWYAKMISDMRKVAPYMSLDHYPLTPYDVSDQAWIAWQRCDYEGNAGLIMAFRRANATESCRTFALRGLNPQKQYLLTDIDSGELGIFSGEALAKGFTVEIPQPRNARIILFQVLE
ncbi:MAG: alpha-galactosidase [Oscillospiraceae bacterium]|nr:alpha-galactosidase [Oscillospiraceae bacterium]